MSPYRCKGRLRTDVGDEIVRRPNVGATYVSTRGRGRTRRRINGCAARASHCCEPGRYPVNRRTHRSAPTYVLGSPHSISPVTHNPSWPAAEDGESGHRAAESPCHIGLHEPSRPPRSLLSGDRAPLTY